MATKTAQTVRFLSEHRRLKLIRQSQGEILMPGGGITYDPTRPSVHYWFTDGELLVTEGQDMLADKVDPDTGELVEQDALSWLRAHRDYGTAFYEVQPVAPPVGDALSKIALAAAAGDVAELVRLGDEEAESWNRDEVLDVIRASIENIEGTPAKE